MITCAVCGASNEPEAVFCGTCGNRLGAAPETGAPAEAVPPAVAPSGPKLPASIAAAEPAPAPVVASAPAATAAPPPATPDDGRITCPVCGTRNEPSRSFCRKCASPLRPLAAPDPNRGWTRQFVLTFVVSAAVGITVVLGGAALLQPQNANASPVVAVAARDGHELDFAVTPANPQPLPMLPVTSTIQLTSFKQAAASTSNPPGDRVKPPWWNDAVPRVPAVSQFDGGPLQRVNCVMAAGAMLARLGYGIVTTGSQLRGLQDDQDGATNYADLQTAVGRGWGVHFFRGDLSALQFRALLWAGAGVVIGITYGQLPVPDRVQESFTGNHSIYVDAFRPAGADGPAAYYVMDPIGHTWAGYRGAWLPAADVERAAKAHSAGKITGTWAFAGGVVPADHRVLPVDAYPIDEPPPSQGPGGSGGPSGSGGPIVDPLPLGDLPVATDPPIGDPPPDTPPFPHPEFLQDAFFLDAGTEKQYCSVLPTPRGCPDGILGIIAGGDLSIQTATSPPNTTIKLLYADAIAPGTYQIIFESPPATQNDLWFWGTGANASLEQATVEAGYIGGDPISIATISLDPTQSYSFLASSTGDGVRSLSSVGSLTVTP